MTIERVVRPFQTTEVFGARVLPPQPAVPGGGEDAKLIWKGSADGKYVEEPTPAVIGFQNTWEEDKDRRKTTKVRIENPDDSSQFVETERIDEMVLKNNRTAEEIPIKMKWDK